MLTCKTDDVKQSYVKSETSRYFTGNLIETFFEILYTIIW